MGLDFKLADFIETVNLFKFGRWIIILKLLAYSFELNI